MSITNESKVSISTNPKLFINISDSSSLKQLFDNMKNDLSVIISYMDVSINQCTEKNTQLVSQKEEITNLTNLAKKYNQESIQLDSKLSKYLHDISMAEHELLKSKTAFDGVMQITSDLPQTESDKIKTILEDSFMKKTHDLENINKELELFEKTKNLKDEKVGKLQDSLSKMEASYFEQVSNTNLFSSNVEKTVLDISQMYSDIMSKFNDMLQMTINVKQNTNVNVIIPSTPINNNDEKQEQSESIETVVNTTSQPIFNTQKNFDAEKEKLLKQTT